MAAKVRPIRTKRDHEAALKEVERIWGAKTGTRDGDRLDVLATLIDAYEAEHYPMDPPDPVEAIKFRMEQQGLTRRDLVSDASSEAFLRTLDDWRSAQIDLPSRAEAIRRMVELAAKMKRKPDADH